MPCSPIASWTMTKPKPCSTPCSQNRIRTLSRFTEVTMAVIQPVSEILWTNSSKLFTYHSGIFVSNGEAVVIDPGLSETEINALMEAIGEQGWNVRTVILTHG